MIRSNKIFKDPDIKITLNVGNAQEQLIEVESTENNMFQNMYEIGYTK